MEHLGHIMRGSLDAIAAGSILATLAGWLPPLAALMGICWYCVLFYDRFVRVKR